MTTIKKTEKKWVQAFKSSPLVSSEGKFLPDVAHKLFHEGIEEQDLKEGFKTFYSHTSENEYKNYIPKLVKFLSLIGISVERENILQKVESGSHDLATIYKKAFYIFKTLTYYDDNLDVSNPYHDNMGDIYYLLRIEEGSEGKNSQISIFEQPLPELYEKTLAIPDNFEEDKASLQLFNEIEESNKSFFITGRAGTGKSTFVRYFTQNTNKTVLLFAFTGIAAINIGGMTLHSFFRFPFKPMLPEDSEIPVFKPYSDKVNIIRKAHTIVIDEVSMLRADVLEAVDYSLRMNGGNKSVPFGGKQMLFVGDIFQLPPIVTNDKVEKELFRELYKSQYFFDSFAYKKLDPTSFEFQKIHRQKDAKFINLLNEVRDYSIDQAGIDYLNQNFKPNFRPEPREFVILLSSTNYIAKKENKNRLEQLHYKSFHFEAEIEKDFREDRYPTDKILELKREAQVIFVKNDVGEGRRRWVNGTLAKIEDITDESIKVRLANGDVHQVFKEEWENRKYKWNKKEKRITSEVIGVFRQYPLKLAWAITIHKSQGLTFDKVAIDMGSGAFTNGQLYTALSRCRSLDGLVLKRKIGLSDVIKDPQLSQFDAKITGNPPKLINRESIPKNPTNFDDLIN